MKVRIAINGFGRIGRTTLKLALKHYDNIEVVAINDLINIENLVYLLKYDSVYGAYENTVTADGKILLINDKHKIKLFSEKDPKNLPWSSLNVDVVIESTGCFLTTEKAQSHIDAGAKRVIISAPPKDNTPIYVMGINHKEFKLDTDYIISNASCTSNCLAPIAKVLNTNFGIEEGLMTTIHAITPSQPTHDGPSGKDFRSGRAAFQNIIPASTGAAKALGKFMPELNGKLTGMAFRVPVQNVSVVDLTVKLTKSTDYDTICSVMKKQAETELKGILAYTEELNASTDFLGNKHSAIFDARSGIPLNNNFYKIISWYDNETGYSCRLLDLISYITSKENP